mmetsp:Transcript_3736/g.3249  ORF Transcript_3736/g.3249 Transcript_3736/m.3249 type:complete len:81 (+) Transcript_3736:211-453(+)
MCVCVCKQVVHLCVGRPQNHVDAESLELALPAFVSDVVLASTGDADTMLEPFRKACAASTCTFFGNSCGNNPRSFEESAL